MIVAGWLVVLLGTSLVLVSLLAMVMRAGERRLVRRLTAAARWSCSAGQAAGRLPRYVLVSGRTAPGPAGLQRSPAYDAVCVWFRTDVLREDPEGGFSSQDVAADSKALVRRTAPGLIGVADHTGRALVDLRRVPNRLGDDLVTRRTEYTTLSRRYPAGDGSALHRLERAGLLPARAHGLIFGRSLEVREEFIAPDQPITVLGRPRRQRDGSLLLTRSLAISSDDPDRWVSRAHEDVASSGTLVRFLPIGLAVSVLGAAFLTVGVLLS